MKKLFSILLKLIPIVTLYHGITSGGARIDPFLQTMKVMLTQYETTHIANRVIADLKATNGRLVAPELFSEFVRNKYYDQYSVLARELSGDKSHNHAIDIWGTPFFLVVAPDESQVTIASAGPDKKPSTLDDVTVSFPFKEPKVPAQRQIATKPVEAPEQAPVEDSEDYDVDGFDHYGFDRNGFDRDGFNRDGFDQEGFDRTGFDLDGFDRNGFDREGYDQDGFNANGEARP